MFASIKKAAVIAGVAGTLLAAGPAVSAHADTATQSRSGTKSTLTFSWVDNNSWNRGTLKVYDTSADSSSVYAVLYRAAGAMSGEKECYSGSGNSCTFNSLYFDASSTIDRLYIRGCVNSIGTDECSNGGSRYNPYG